MMQIKILVLIKVNTQLLCNLIITINSLHTFFYYTRTESEIKYNNFARNSNFLN